MRKGIGTLLLLLVVPAIGLAQPAESQTPADSASIMPDSTTVDSTRSALTTVVYYFHGNKRCVTCRKIEALSEQSLRTGFEAELADSSLIWRVVNFEEPANKEFAKKYKLFSQTLIVSRQRDGEEIDWTNLDKIWQLVHDDDAFVQYVRNAVSESLSAEPE